MSISLIQRHIAEEGLDGWLLYDFHSANDLMGKVCKIPKDTHITRRIWIWIPKVGEPVKIVSAIESHVLDFFEGKTETYKTCDEMKAVLSKHVTGKIAMEVSNEIPTISKVDAGTYELVRGLGFEVVSSGKLLQKFTSVLSDEQIASHLRAAKVASDTADETFSFIRGELLQGKLLYEGDVQAFILNCFTNSGCITDHSPIVARGKNSANPHYEPKGRGDLIVRGDFILIDLWCKERGDNGVFADITRVCATENPSSKIKDVFEIVRTAQKKAVSYIESQKCVKACDVDQLVRDFLEEEGFTENIFHRLGHNITFDLHADGANFDSFETMDTRELIDKTCYSIEPALYFPDEFGLRLEHDILYDMGKVQVTAGVQDELLVLF